MSGWSWRDVPGFEDGPPTGRRAQRWTDMDQDNLADLMADDLSSAEIARRMNRPVDEIEWRIADMVAKYEDFERQQDRKAAAIAKLAAISRARRPQ